MSEARCVDEQLYAEMVDVEAVDLAASARLLGGHRSLLDLLRGEASVISALFVETNGVYFGLDNVDPWDITRDARQYRGPHPVIAHPPCSTWCQLAYINQKRYGHKVGEDGGCFASALASVTRWGGVLEHPANSYAWPAFDLVRPVRGRWTQDGPRRWLTEVSQSAYGHRARKRTWLLYVGDREPPAVDWREPAPTAQVSFCKNHGNSPLPRLSKKEAKATPIAFREELIRLALYSGNRERVSSACHDNSNAAYFAGGGNPHG